MFETWKPANVLLLRDVFPNARISRSGKTVKYVFRSKFLRGGKHDYMAHVVWPGTRNAHIVVKIDDEIFLLRLRGVLND